MNCTGTKTYRMYVILQHLEEISADVIPVAEKMLRSKTLWLEETLQVFQISFDLEILGSLYLV